MEQNTSDSNPIRILHISDFHLNGKYIEDAKTLLNNLLDAIEQSNQQIDLVAFSGDMIDKGGKDFNGGIVEAFDTFKSIVIDAVCDRLQIPTDRFIFTPGNHDVNTEKANKYADKTIDTDCMNSEDNVNKFIREDFNTNSQRIEDVKEFEKRCYSDIMKDKYYHDLLASNFVYSINNKSVGVTSLNTVWRYNDESKCKNKIILGLDQIVDSQQKIKDCQLKLAITHYDYTELAEFERDKVKDMVAQNYDIFFAGHTHSSTVDFISISSGSSFLHVKTAGSLIANKYISSEDYQNSFHIISYYQDYIEVILYKQENGQNFKQDKSFGNTEDGSGIYREQIPTREKSIELAKNRLQDEQKHQEELFLKGIRPFTTIAKFVSQLTDELFKMDFVTCKRIDEIITTLKNPSIHNIHFLALSGMGKTRIIMETFNGEDNVFYSPTADCIDKLRNLITERPGCTVIVDDCDNDQRRNLKKIIKNDNRLITINNELSFDEELVDGDVLIQFDYDEANEVVKKLIEKEKGITIDETNIGIIHEYTGNIPYMAILLIEAYKNRGALKIDNADAIFTALLRGRGKIDDNQEKVLKAIALFNPLGYSNSLKDEYEYIRNNSRIHHIINNQEYVDTAFDDTIKIFLKKRKLIEYKGNCIRIRPKPLADWLTKCWLMEYGNNIPNILENLHKQDTLLANRLVQAFSSRIENMIDYCDAKELFDKLHNIDNGPFHDERIAFSETGSRLFLSMGTVSPVMVAKNIYSLLSVRENDKNWLEENVSNEVRRNLVYALERISLCNTDAFPFVAKSLLILASAENESFSNNSRGIFLQLFHIQLSGTNAPLSVRIEILEENYTNPEYTKIIISAIDSAFKSRDFVWVDTMGISQSPIKVDNNYNPRINEVYNYWNRCADILISISNSTNDFDAKIMEIINRHISDYYDLNDIQILTKLLDYYGEKCNYDWPELRKTLRLNIKYWSKDNVEKVRDSKKWYKLFEPKSFLLRVKDTIDNTYIEERENYNLLDDKMYSQMIPYAKEFLDKKIYRTNEMQKILKDFEFQTHYYLFVTAVAKELNNSLELIKEIFDSFLHYIPTENKLFESPFITQFCSEITKGRDTDIIEQEKAFIEELYKKEYYRLSASIEGIIDDENHSLLSMVISKYKQGNYDNYCINNYIRRYSWQNERKDILPITEELMNEGIDEDEVIFPYFTNGIMLSNIKSIKDENTLSQIERILLSYSFMGKSFRTAYQVVEVMSDVLEIHDRPDFALQVHKKIVSVLSSNETTIHDPFDRIYETLLPKYQKVILKQLFEDFAAEDQRINYYWKIHFDLGSSFSFSDKKIGPLFKCDYKYLKEACLKYSKTLPKRMANICPLIESGKEVKDTFFWWLCDNFGDRKDVLNEFSANIESYSYVGGPSDSFANYIESRKNIITPYLQHPNKTVQEWAQRQIELIDKEVNYERGQEEYTKMIHQR